MATHSSILAWRVPWTEELGSLQSMRSRRVRHNRVTNPFTFSFRLNSGFVCFVAQSCLTASPWTVAHQAPLSMEFSRQEYWSGMLFRSPGDLPTSGIKPTFLVSPALSSWFLTASATWEAPTMNLSGCNFITSQG